MALDRDLAGIVDSVDRPVPKVTMPDKPGFFEIPRVRGDISFEDFYRDYFEPEAPLIIEGAGREWPALQKWNPDYLRERLSNEPSVKNIVLFLLLDNDVLTEDFSYPDFINKMDDPEKVFPYKSNTRIWINSRNNISAWHFDTGVVNNFNTQITGRKEWTIVSPQTPPRCYPFSNFVVLEEDEEILKNKIFTKFVTNPGDMLYLPPLWYHKVRALDERNINLMWVFTKRKTSVSSPALARDELRYRMHWYLARHRYAAVKKVYAKILTRVPGFLKITWHFDQLIETDIMHTRSSRASWLFKELAMLGKTIVTMPKIRKQLRTSEKAPRFSSVSTKTDSAGY